MADAEKPSFDKYPYWLRDKLGISIGTATRKQYKLAVAHLREQTEASEFWRTFQQEKMNLDRTYFDRTGFGLYMSIKDVPAAHAKSYDSLFEKSYRKNVQDNESWDQPPAKTGWILPTDWLSKINDVVRTLVVVKYLDGVIFLAEALTALAEAQGRQCHVDYEAREEGYYAAHVYPILAGQVPAETYGFETVQYQFEIQITTQLQDVIRPVTHPLYAKRRMKLLENRLGKWQWDYQADEFRANYLVHSLHHIDGLIVDVRRRLRGE